MAQVRELAKSEKVKEILSSLPFLDIIDFTDNTTISPNKNPERVVTVRLAVFDPKPVTVPKATYTIVKRKTDAIELYRSK